MKIPPPDTEEGRAIGLLATGRTNSGGTVTLSTGSTTTKITDNAIHVGDYVILQPLTAGARAEQIYSENGASSGGTISLYHSSDTSTGRTFYYEIRGT